MALRPARVAHDEDESAFLHAGRLHAQPALRVIGHVVLRVGGGLAVLADVGPEEGPVAGVTRPAPVVGLAAEVADPDRGGVAGAHVRDLELGDLVVLEPAEEGLDAAAQRGLGRLRGVSQAATRSLMRRSIRPKRRRSSRRRSIPPVIASVTFRDGDSDVDACPRAVRDLFLARLREEAVHQQVALGRRVVLERRDGAVVVRHDQAVGRDERGGAAPEGHDRAHRLSGEVGEGLWVAREAQRREPLRQLGYLLRHPHALVGGEGRGESERGDEHEAAAGGEGHGVSLLGDRSPAGSGAAASGGPRQG